MKACESYGAFLITFKTYREEVITNGLTRNRYYWIGITKRKNKWTWDDGTDGSYIKLKGDMFEKLNKSREYAHAVADRVEKTWTEVNSTSLEFAAVCKHTVGQEFKRPCEKGRPPSKDVCYIPTLHQQEKHSYREVDSEECPRFPHLENFYYQKPKAISVDNGQQHYCIYDLKMSLDFEAAEKFCIDEVRGHLIYLESREEFRFLHENFLRSSIDTKANVRLSPIIENLEQYSDIMPLSGLIKNDSGNFFVFTFPGQDPKYTPSQLRTLGLSFCYPNWTSIADRCYRYYPIVKDYESASRACRSMRSTTLGVYTTIEEMKLQKKMENVVLDSLQWIGLDIKNNKFLWHDNSNFNINVSAFNNKKLQHKTDCIGYTRELRDTKCTEKHTFVCSYNNNIRKSTPDDIHRTVCKKYFKRPKRKLENTEKEGKKTISHYSKSLCPINYFEYKKKCFLFKKPASWNEARRNCEIENAMLAVLSKKDYEDFPKDLNGAKLWIGLRKGVNGWQWPDMSKYKKDVPLQDEDYSCAYAEIAKEWTTESCERPMNYLCMFEPEKECRPGFVKFKGSCYTFENHAEQLITAQRTCNAKGSNVVWINSKEEQDFLNVLAKNNTFWIALREDETWLWFGKWTPDFLNWGKFKPDGCCDKFLMNHVINEPNGWRDKDAFSKYKFICKYEMGSKNFPPPLTDNITRKAKGLRPTTIIRRQLEIQNETKDLGKISIFVIIFSILSFIILVYHVCMVIKKTKKDSPDAALPDSETVQDTKAVAEDDPKTLGTKPE